MKVAIIGGGSMGLAFARRWLDQKVIQPENLCIIEASADRRDIIQKELKIKVNADEDAVSESQLVFIAVKPQDFENLAVNLSKVISAEKLVISIMAGVPISKISTLLVNHKRIVRVMPNLPVVVGSGLCSYFATPQVEHNALEVVEQFLTVGGAVLRLKEEDLLNAVTAISGSGPGYIYYAIENVLELCEEFGFTKEESEILVASTLDGAVKLWRSDVCVNKRSAKELRALVTSKGGTTEAAISHFDKKNLGDIIKEALRAALGRARELAG